MMLIKREAAVQLFFLCNACPLIFYTTALMIQNLLSTVLCTTVYTCDQSFYLWHALRLTKFGPI